MAKKEKGTRQKKKKGRSTQELLGIKTFTKYGLAVGKYELLFYMIAPTNISVLSRANIEIKIHHLMMVLSAVPDIEVMFGVLGVPLYRRHTCFANGDYCDFSLKSGVQPLPYWPPVFTQGKGYQ